MMPDGMSCSAVFTPLMTSVWPALWPPWKRATPCAWSVSQSTTLPLPSSPHWVPTTTTLRPSAGMGVLPCCIKLGDQEKDSAARQGRSGGDSGGRERAQGPSVVDGDQFAVAGEFLRFVVVPGQGAH